MAEYRLPQKAAPRPAGPVANPQAPDLRLPAGQAQARNLINDAARSPDMGESVPGWVRDLAAESDGQRPGSRYSLPRTRQAAEEPPRFLAGGSFKGFSSSDPADSIAGNPGLAGLAIAGVEMIKGIAQLTGHKSVVDWADSEKSKFWSSKEQGGFFGDPAAEYGRIAANSLASIYGAAKLSQLLPTLVGSFNSAFGASRFVPSAARLANSYTGKIASGTAVGGGLAALQETPETSTKAEQTIIGALVGGGLTAGLGLPSAISDYVKQRVGSNPLGGPIKDLNPFGSNTVNAPNPRLSTPQRGVGDAQAQAAGTHLTYGQRLRDETLLDREITALASPGGRDLATQLSRDQSAATQRLAGAQSQGVGTSESLGQRLQYTGRNLWDTLMQARQGAWNQATTPVNQYMDSRVLNMQPYVRALMDTLGQYGPQRAAGGGVSGTQLTSEQADLIHKAIQRRLAQVERTNPPGMGTGREVQGLLQEAGEASFGTGNAISNAKVAADNRVSRIVKNALDDVLELNKQNHAFPGAVARQLQQARNQWAQRSIAIDAFERSPMAQTLAEAKAPEEVVRALTKSNNPSQIRQAMSWLDDLNPQLGQDIRGAFARDLATAGATPGTLSSPRHWSPTRFLAQRPVSEDSGPLNREVAEAILGPRGMAGMNKAYDLAQATSRLEFDPKLGSGLETIRGAQGAQAMAGAGSGSGIGSWAPSAGRWGAFEVVAPTMRRLLVDPRHYGELERLHNYQTGPMLRWIDPVSAALAAQLLGPSAPDEPTVPPEETGPALNSPRYQIRR